jgi:hypothetical protein
MRISAAQRAQNENHVRAAMDRLLRGEIPPDGNCDVKTLAREVVSAATVCSWVCVAFDVDESGCGVCDAGCCLCGDKVGMSVIDFTVQCCVSMVR